MSTHLYMKNAPQFKGCTYHFSGVTLIELLVSIAMLGILMSLAAPSFQTLIESSRLKTVTNDLLVTFAQARSNATRIGARVTVCKSSSSTQCATSGDWEQGWIMFTDTTRSGSAASVDSGEAISSVFKAPGGNIVIKGNTTYVSYAADGQPKTMTGGFLAGKIRVCSTTASLSNDVRARDLVLNSAGRIVIEYPTGIGATCPAP